MGQISQQQYEFAQNRIEKLLPLVSDETSVLDSNAIELSLMSDIVITYEKEHYPIEVPTIAELIALSLEEKGLSKKALAEQIGISQSRISDYLSGRAEPTLKIARSLCLILGISPAQMLGIW